MESGTVSDWLSHFPEIVALIVVVLGWFLARLLKNAVAAGMPLLNRLSARWGAQSGSLLSPKFSRLVEAFVFWGVWLISFVIAVHLLGGGEPSQWLDGLLAFVSRLLFALAILVGGHILGLLARSLLNGLSGSIEMSMLPRSAYAVIVAVAALTALKQLGLDVSFITQVVLVLVTVFLAGLALAFALGARSLVANLAAQGELQRYKPGDRLIVDGISGTVLEINRTGVVLSTSDGVASVPAARFAESTVITLQPGKGDG